MQQVLTNDHRPEFAPPPQRGTLRALILALIAHALLIAALTWGLHWRNDSGEAVEAELWSNTVQQAAPAAPTVPTPTPAPPQPQPETSPPPPPRVAPTPKPSSTPDIALEREKKRQQEKQRQEQEREQQEKQQQQKKQREQEQAAREKAEQDKAQQQKEEQQKAALQKRANEKKLQATKDREDRLRQLQALAGTGNSSATGTAAQSSGPSAGYGARVAAAVRRHLHYSPTSDNPRAEFNVRVAADGTILSASLSKSSGVPSWDDAAQRALLATQKMPPDIDGRVPSEFIVGLTPND
ncbi:MAG: TonB C-terminal domain-containing protein [Burkholderiaceae bacterium]|nr:TonB C-terminal domain-containing protein [Burkholderiaceae bacterium]